jgi:hypothetical protein
LVRALGVERDKLVEHLGTAFAQFGFRCERIKLSDFIRKLRPDLDEGLCPAGS